jgi:tRNA A-37 threonylcarbamoyl transferase component Bud32
MSRALGRYELLRPLARGGMGEVYLARRRAAGVEKWLVVKRMRPEKVGDARFLDLFKREAKLSMSLAHQNIVPVFDFGRIDDQVFLAMERVEGKDLGSSITKAGKPLPPLIAAFIAAECLQALDYAHHRKGQDGQSLGIVHRDVTPRNVLLSWSGEVKLTDFGIAALAGDDPAQGKMAGTPTYMAPEQARGEPDLDARADVYAVGMVLREAITGERPRKGERDPMMQAAKDGTLEPWPAGFESPLKGIVERATAVDKLNRYPDARAMLEALDEFIVAERAAKKSEAPARLVAVWLAEVWEGEVDEVAKFDAKIEAGELMSFMDDGALDAIGTGTQRSALATAAEQTPPSGVKAIVDEAPPPAPAPVVEKRRSRAPLLLLLLPVAGVITYVAWPNARVEKVELPPEPPAVVEEPKIEPPVVVVDAGVVDSAVADARVVEALIPVDARPAKQIVVEKRQPRASVDAGVVATEQKSKHRVTLNTSPQWSWFTVDNDATKYQTPGTIELPAGTHTIHFTGNEYFPADKSITIEVGDKDVMRAVKLAD